MENKKKVKTISIDVDIMVKAFNNDTFISNMHDKTFQFSKKQYDSYIKYKQLNGFDSVDFLTTNKYDKAGGIGISEEGIEIFKKWIKFCYENNINLLIFILENANTDAEIIKNHIENNGDKVSNSVANYTKLVYHLFVDVLFIIFDSIDSIDRNKVFPTELIQEKIQKCMDNSYEIAMKECQINIMNTIKNIPIKELNFKEDEIKNIIDDIKNEHSIHQELFTNSKRYTKVITNNHYMSKLLNDDIGTTADGKQHFNNFTNGLIDGYTAKGILIGTKNSPLLIKALKKKIKELEFFNTNESEKLILISKTMIEFFLQSKYANFLPFKAISKKLDLSKNEVKNYAKKVLPNMSETTLKNNYDKLNLTLPLNDNSLK